MGTSSSSMSPIGNCLICKSPNKKKNKGSCAFRRVSSAFLSSKITTEQSIIASSSKQIQRTKLNNLIQSKSIIEMCCDIIINYNRHTNINLCSSVCEGGEEFIDEIAMENKNINESNYLDDKSIELIDNGVNTQSFFEEIKKFSLHMTSEEDPQRIYVESNRSSSDSVTYDVCQSINDINNREQKSDLISMVYISNDKTTS